MKTGIAASRGIAIGRAYVLAETNYLENLTAKAENLQQEIFRLDEAIHKAISEIQGVKEKALRELNAKHAAIFDAHISILQDETLHKDAKSLILSDCSKAECAVKKTMDGYCSLFDQMEDEYLKERAGDFRDVSSRLLRCLSGEEGDRCAGMAEDCIVIARDLTPSDTAHMDKEKVKAIVTELGGRTSHTAIMARSLEIPAVLGIKDIAQTAKNGDLLIVDGTAGIVIVNPGEEQLRTYEQKRLEYIESQNVMQQLVDLPAVTKDGGRRVELAVNIGSAEDCASGLRYGAEGVGLFRTEFLYMNRATLPDEEEQYLAYRKALEAMGSRAVIIRTLDIGGDKSLPYLQIEPEMNPFLGMRAIRLCLQHPHIFKSQLRAILRASCYGKARIMYPMIAAKWELKAANQALFEAMAELDSQGIPYNKHIEKGIMIEIPAAAIVAEHFVEDVDFFSIGSNDLVQYTLAVDRLNEKMSDFYKPLHPAVLRLIKHVIDVSHRAGKWTGMCGEMAGEEKYAPLLIGMGLDEFSMSASSLLTVKKTIRNLDYAQAKQLAREALELGEAAQVTELLKGYY